MIRCITCGHSGYEADCDCCNNFDHCDNCKQIEDPDTGSCDWCCQCHGEYPCPGNDDFGSAPTIGSQLTPWEKRGVKLSPNLKYPNWQVAWPLLAQSHASLDVCQFAADFYILDALRHTLINREHECTDRPCRHLELWRDDLRPEAVEANALFTEVLELLDRVFCEYVEMACGGELRHHGACGGESLSGHRRTAWADWRWIHEQLGHQALLDGAALFDEFPQGAFGGARWAHALRLLHRRLTGAIAPITWVDQVFTLVHNGGVFLNKLDWGVKNGPGWSLQDLQHRVLPAQERDAWPILLRVASDDVRRQWDRYWRRSNRARVQMAMPPAVNHRTHPRRRTICGRCGSNPRVGHLMTCKSFLEGALQQGIDVNRVIDESDWNSYMWHVWEADILPVKPDGTVRMMPSLFYSLSVEVHTTHCCRIRKFKLSGAALMETTMQFNRAMPTVPEWDEGQDSEFWFVIELMEERERVRLAGFESRKTTNRDTFKKKYLAFGHILPLVMPDLDWSHMTKEQA